MAELRAGLKHLKWRLGPAQYLYFVKEVRAMPKFIKKVNKKVKKTGNNSSINETISRYDTKR